MKEKLLLINKKFKKLCNEIAWRIKTSDYNKDDISNHCLHETIHKDVSFMSVNDIEELCDELGTSKILEIEQSFRDKFGDMDENKKGIDKLRVILYWYFEQRYKEEKV